MGDFMRKSILLVMLLGVFCVLSTAIALAENDTSNERQANASTEFSDLEDQTTREWRDLHQNEPISPQASTLDPLKNSKAIAITQNNNATDLLNAFLVANSGIIVTNVTYTGHANGAGTYTGGPLGIDDGTILASGHVDNALPPNNSDRTSTNFNTSGCDWCDSLSDGHTTYDAAILEITFDAAVVCSAISMDFIFGSEEYPEYVSTEYNDVFGVFLNGSQIAFDAFGNPITINGGFFDSTGYVQIPPDNGMEYDGSTLKLTTVGTLVPGSSGNTLVLVVCDASDHVWDSGVLLANLEGSGDIPPCTGVSPDFVRPPTPGDGDTMYIHADELLTFSIEAEDLGPNNDTLTLTAVGLPTGASMSPSLPQIGNPVSSSFSWTPTSSDAGVHAVTFIATDSEMDSCQLSDQTTVYINVCPTGPTCNLPSDQTIFVCGDTTLSFPVSAEDDDSNPVGCTLTSGVGTLASGIWSFDVTSAGVYSASFECEDDCGGTCSGTVNITVSENSAPVCNIPSNQTFFICNDTTFSFPVSATDSDGNLEACIMTSGSGSFDGSDWTFTTTGTGVYSATFECADSCGETCGGTVNITVTKNSTPVCSIPPDQSFFICSDSTFTFPVSATDADGNLMGCTMTSGPGTFDGSDWTFTTTGAGDYVAVFECEDSCGVTCGETSTITITQNSAPVCSIPSDQSFFVCDDTTFTFPVSATDTDGNLTGCTMTSGDGTFDGSNWTFTTSGAGTYSATFECTDACGETCGGIVNITVTQNSTPVCNIPSDQSFFICNDSTFTFPVSATDADGNLTGCTMTSGDGSYDGSDWTFTTSGAGTYSASFECTDACGEICGGTVNMTITKNSAPVCSIPSDQSFFVCDDSTFTFPVSATDTDGNLTGCMMTSGDGTFDGSNWTFTSAGSGVYSATFECTDACGETCGGTVNITVTKNSVPVCNIPSDQSFFVCADTTFTFPVSAIDADGNLTGCTMTTGDGSFDGSNWTFTTAGAGIYSATFECTDACGETCGGTVDITVTQNSIPVCDIPSDQSFFVCADTTFTFPVSATDVDGNLTGCSLTSGDGSFDGSNWTFTTSGAGIYSATFECTDACGETCGRTVNIAVTQNSAPVCSIPSDQSFFICDDTTFTFPVSATDVDGNITGLTMTSGDGTFDGSDWTFTTSGAGVYSGTFECIDACGETCGGTVDITVTKNSTPICNIPSNQSFFVCNDTTFTFPVSASDVDGNLTGCIKTSGDGSFDGSNWTFTTSGAGVYSAAFECTDACGEICTGSVNITVTKNSVPVCNLPTDQSFFVCTDTTFTFPVSATDADGNLVGCTMTSGSGTFDGSNWTFTTSGAGVYSATFECTDACGETCGGTVNITVTQNSAPVCSIPSNQSFFTCNDTTFTFPVSASDVDGNLTGCNMTSGSGSFDGSNWTFTTAGAGIYSATFECTDACGETCGGTVNITVTQNSVPVCNIPSDQSFFICNDSTFTFPVSASDVDGNLNGCTMTSGDGTFDGSNWTFTASGSGTYSATFECTDACGEACGGTVNITVTKNSVPVCDIPSDQSFFVCADTTFTFPVSASDIDGNLTGCTMTSGDGSFDGSNWTFTTAGAGTYSATFECTDACGETCGGTVNITVTQNSVPVCTIPSDQSFFICADSTFTFPVSATDADGNLVGCTMTSGSGSFDGSNWTFTTSGSGIYTGVFECTDECGETCGGTVNITVTKNSDPVCSLPPDATYFTGSDTTFVFPVSATDVDGNLVGCTMTSGSGTFDGSNWTFTTSGPGVYSGTFECTDACGATCGGTVNIVFSSNSAPECSLPANQSFFICDDTTFSFIITAIDDDENLIGCTKTSGPGTLTDSVWTFTTSGSGVYSATFVCEDSFGEVCGGTVDITVTKNSIPVCDLPANATIFQCTPAQVSLPVSATDVDGNLVSCQITSGPGALNGGNWQYTPSGDETANVTIRCTDECGDYCEETFTITFEINEAPVCDLPSDQSFFICADSTFTFPVSATDGDDNLTGCTMTSGSGSFDGSYWTFTTSGAGVYSATFECEDECGETCGGTVNITVTQNVAPVCSAPSDQSFFICNDSTFTFPVSASDVDGNLSGCTMTSGAGSFDGSNWTFATSGSGVYSATFECTDACGETCSESVNITVTHNSVPVCNIPSDQSFFICTDTTLTFPVSASDVDGNLVGCTMTSGSGSFDGSTWTLNTSGSGIYSATFECADACGETCGGTVNITITQNSAPVCDIPADQSFFVCADTNFSFPISASDVDGNLSGCSMASGVGSFDGSNWTFTTSGAGVYSASFECTDACGETCSGSVNITVTQNSVPVCSIPSDQSFFICNDTTFSFPVSATDVDGNLVGCTLTSGTGNLSGGDWTFTTSGSGVYSASFECVDECGEVCTGSVSITVTQNSAPICSIPSDQSFFICSDTTFSFPISASDVDGNLTGCSLTSGIGSFDGSNWTFNANSSGVYSATFVCSDACGETCSGTINITVTRNTDPVCTIPSDQSFFVCSDTTFSFPISASDADGNLTGCSMTSGPGTFDGSNWTFTSTASGVYSATFECADACGATCGGTVNITVTENSTPVCDIPSDQSFFICDDTTFVFPILATDADGNLIGCTMTSGGGSFDGSNWTFTTSGTGVYSATFECTDECGATCGGTVNIDVTHNSTPICTLPESNTIFQCTPTLISLPFSATDVDGNLTGCEIISGPGTLVGGNWEYMPSIDEVIDITIRCTDACGVFCEGSFQLDIGINETPVCNIPSDQSFFVCSDTTFSFPISATDADGNLVGCTMTSGVGSFDGSNWTFATTESGIYSATFECNDECDATCGGTVNITVTENSTPVCDIPSDQSFFICTDQTFTFPISATDVDGNLTGCTMTSGPGSFDGSEWVFTTTGTGIYSATFECLDECGASCSGTISIDVTHNSTPVCDIPGDSTIFQCTPTLISLPFTATDADDNLFGCEIISGPGSLNSGNWEYMPTVDEVINITIRCSDECGVFCEESFQLDIGINETPVCDIPADQSLFLCADTTLIFPISATDSDGNLVGCTMTTGVGSFDGTNWTFTTSGAGIYSATFECEDECGETCGSSINITTTLNSAPVCEIPSDTTFFICADTTFSYTITSTDVDDNLVECTMISGVGSFDGSVWTFTTSGTGVYNASFACTDECGESCGGTVSITVEGNTAPVCTLPANETYFICSDTTFSFPISATDTENNLVGCTMTSGDGSFDGSTWTFNTASPGGIYTATFECIDVCGAICGGTVEINIAYNLFTPVCEVPNDTAIFQCTATEVCLPVTATDEDGNLVGCEITAGPGVLDNGLWCYTPIADDVLDVVITCTDICGETCVDSFHVEFEVNIPPYVEVPEDTIIFQECMPLAVCLPISAEDDEDNIVSREIINGPGELIGDEWCYTPSGIEPIEIVEIIIRWTDDCDAFTEDSFTVTFEIPKHFAVINLDRSGSMYITTPLGESRLSRAKEIAHEDVDKLLDPLDLDYPGMYWIAVMSFNASEIDVFQDFTYDSTTLHDAIEGVTRPKHDTPLAAAMCQATCILPDCVKYVFTYTNGSENASQSFDMCGNCASCSSLMYTGWDNTCDPLDTTTVCTEWQSCVYDQLVTGAHHCIHYFDTPEDPFNLKNAEIYEDIYYLKALGDESDGCFFYHSDTYTQEVLCGDANNDWSVNVSDAVWIVNYVFIGGPPPDPMEAGDANCDGTVNISDAVWIINYVFVGGNPPCDVDGDGSPDC
jgi:Dockerin type I domain